MGPRTRMRPPLRSVSVATLAGVVALAHGASAQTRAGSSAPAAAPAPAVADPFTSEQPLSDEAELARIVGLVGAARYEECSARLGVLLNPKAPRALRDSNVIENARIYHATCLIGLDKVELADEPLRAAIRKNPQMRAPDSLVFPQKVVDRFLKVREELYAELRAAERAQIEKARREAREKQRQDSEDWARMLVLERLARQEVVVTRNRRWIAVVPFGAGQFQNGDDSLGWVFLGTEAALGITALTSLAVHSHLQTEVDRLLARRLAVDPGVTKRLNDWHLALTLSSYAFIGAAAVGILQAQLGFVPEVRTVRERKLPALPESGVKVRPEVSGGQDHVVLGLSGTF
jgi:hypothetical protein